MAAEAVDIDLYADDIEHDFTSDDYGRETTSDLFDDVITNAGMVPDSENDEPAAAGSSPFISVGLSGNDVSSKTNSPVARQGGNQVPKKHQCYVGNLTWFTTDQDVQNCLLDIGIQDFVDIKFHENRSNGQSKGFCLLTVGSEESLRMVYEKVPKKELHSRSPSVLPATKQAFNQFDAKAEVRPGQNVQGNPVNMNMMSPRGPSGPVGPPMGGMGMGFGPRMMMGPIRGGPRGPPVGVLPSHRSMGPNQGPPGNYIMPPNRPPMSLQPLPPGPRHPPGMNMIQGPAHPGPLLHRGPMHTHSPMMDTRGPPPREWSRHPGPAPIQQITIVPPPGAPAPHMNPAFFSPSGPPGPPGGSQGLSQSGHNSPRFVCSSPTARPPPVSNNYSSPQPRREGPVMTDVEVEEKMSRNRAVSSSAISRAVADAEAGEFASAIETLVTAISLIRQSKVAGEDHCRILVSSLQDTLHGIETKSYGRHRERSPCRDPEPERSHRSYRSRSRERDHRERSRISEYRYYEYLRRCSRERESQREKRDRYYEERDRYRDRVPRDLDRDRDTSRSEHSSRSRDREPR